MTISRVGSVSDKKASGSLALLLPSVANGDALTIVAECSDARTFPNPPTGTVNTPTLLPGYPKQGGTNARAYAWRVKLMAADSGQTVSIAPDASNKISAVGHIAHSSVGFDDTFIDDEDYESKAASDVNYNAPAGLSTVAGDWALVIYGTRQTDPIGFSTPAGLTKLQEQLNAGAGATGIALYDSNGSIGGASTTFGPKAATGQSSGAGFGLTLLVKEQQTSGSPVGWDTGIIPIVASTTGGGGGPSPLLVPDSGAWFGVCHNFETLLQYEARVARLVEDQEFKLWTEIFPTAAEQALCDVGGRILLYNWKGNPGWGAIASGVQDAVIDACAARFAAWGKRCLMAFHHEPENDVPASGTPANYRAAYRRVVERFRAAGATNVIWVWKMIGGQFQPVGTAAYDFAGTGDSMWPGADVIDWLAYDPYNNYGCTNSTWHTFEERADQSLIGNFSFYDHTGANMPSKPLMVAETATNEHGILTPTKAEWFTGMLASMKTTLPRIRAMFYFHAGPPTFCDRYIHTSPEAQAAMAAVGADPFFNPTRPTF